VSGENTVGYVLAVLSDKIFHYWFSFYDTKYLEQNIPLGKWMMWKGIRIAKDLGCTHAYLGNGYLETSLYKSRDFNAVEFYDGNGWNSDLKDLHHRCKSDKELQELDLFKLGDDQDKWIGELK
jgi:arginyl-tRNA--protein-N-Asp/Glu arginylyltransferase